MEVRVTFRRMTTSSNGNIFPRYWLFVRGIHRSPVNSPHKCQWRGALMFSLICLNKRLSKQPRCRWFMTPLRWLWRHWNAAIDKRCEHMARLIYPDNGKCKNHIRVWTSNRIRLTGVKRICKLIEFDVSRSVWKYSCIHYHYYASWNAGMTFRRSGCRLLTRRVNTGGRWHVSLNTTVVNITC